LLIGIAMLVLAVVPLFGHGPDQKPAPLETPTAWTAAEFRFVPVRVHLLRAPDSAAGTHLTDNDIERIFRKANGIWQTAGVHLWVESVVEEKPDVPVGHEKDAELPVDVLPVLRPRASFSTTCFHVYYIHAMAPNGIYMGRDAVFVKETAQLRSVPGGIDEPLPRVTAHELGHGMGLPHRQDTTNLLASGTTGTSLNAAEIAVVRHNLAALKWTPTAEDFLKSAEDLAASGKLDAARSRYRALLELPDPSPLKEQARQRLQSGSSSPGRKP